ncbi:hypothetical protein [Bradyrhizobium sp.]|uniref:hypothetical protein n=1 Tax=Bradyrhizobium sp. TaxID=376 RepID=UPI001ED7BA29|nr:hypothetical protein [Bradyrhizobium sp.]MBV9985088.1 hypothetical protein [Bradyrhizobium sp.]
MIFTNLRRVGQVLVPIAVACAAVTGTGSAHAQEAGRASVAPPILPPDFHFSDHARDARYWNLHRDVERTLGAFREAVSSASQAVAVPGPQPGSPPWLEARALVERAMLARRPAREALHALIWFLRHEQSQLTAEEARLASDIIEAHEGTLVATSDHLVDLFARLAGVRVDHWPP